MAYARMSRRQFIRYTSLAMAALAAGGGLGEFLAGCGVPPTSTPVENGASGANGTSAPTSSSSTTETTALPNPNQKVAYLTFDDGPSKVTPELLSILSANHVTATFFVVGLHAQKYPGMLEQMVRGGNAVGVHSWTHDYSYIYKNTRNFLADFVKLKNYITEETRIAPNICRFPGGTNNTVSFRYGPGQDIMRQIVALVEGMGFKYYDWNVSSAEASNPPPSKDLIVHNVVSQCQNKDTAVILFHDVDNQGYLDALPTVIAELRAQGFAFETLSRDNPPESKSALAQFKPAHRTGIRTRRADRDHHS